MKKYISILLSILFVTGSFSAAALPAQAGGKSASSTQNTVQAGQPPVQTEQAALTLDEAVKLALAHSIDLKDKNLTVTKTEKLEDQADEILLATEADTSVGSNTAVNGGNYSYIEDMAAKGGLLNKAGVDVSLDINKKYVEVTKEMVSFGVRQAFDTIVTDKNKLSAEDLLIKNMDNKMSITALKNTVGLESDFNADNMRNDLAKEKKTREQLVKEIDQSYVSLNNLIGKDAGLQYPVVHNAVYSELTDTINVNGHIANRKASDPFIWMQEKSIKISELNLKLYTFSGTDTPYGAREAEYNLDKNAKTKMEESFVKVMNTRYSQIRQLEDSYEAATINLKKAQDALRIVKAQYDVGMAIATDVQEAEIGAQAAQVALDNIVYQHETLKLLFDKPYLYPEYAMS